MPDRSFTDRTLTVGLLHLAPVPGDLVGNRVLIGRATEVAVEAGCDWVVSGELVVTGYDFTPSLGTDWIEPAPDAWLSSYAATTREAGIVAFVHVPERDASGLLRSTLFAIDRDGGIVGRHPKIAVIPGAEAWATAGDSADPVVLADLRVGLLVCADAHPPGIADREAEQGVDLFVSAAAWGLGLHEPDGEWESISDRTGRPVVVANRTGHDVNHDFSTAHSVVAIGGRRVVEVSSPTSAVFVVELTWTSDEMVTACLLDEIAVGR